MPEADAAPRSFSPAVRAGEPRRPIAWAEAPAGLTMAVQQLMRMHGNSTWSQQQELVANEGAGGDEFAYSVAVNSTGATALIGIPGANNAQGAADVFSRSGGTWHLQSALTAGDGTPGDHFGWSVALSGGGNTAVVGADDKAVGSNSQQGAAYVFTRSKGNWFQRQELTAADGGANDNFGLSVALSTDGATALVGAPYRTLSQAKQGAAYVFLRSSNTWSQQQELTANDSVGKDYLGYAVALSASGTTALVGAVGKTVNGNEGQGAAYVFARTASIWSQQRELIAGDGDAADELGSSVALSAEGNTALVGAGSKMVKTKYAQGAAYVFVRSGGTNAAWSVPNELIAAGGSEFDEFGRSVSLSGGGNTALVGAWGKTDHGKHEQGAAYVFARSGGTWSQQGSDLTPSDGANGDQFGWAVALSADGSTALVGAADEAFGRSYRQGAAYLDTRHA